ncbi:MAG TPA: lanthionine synthetase LanC family protein [Longimicrobiaceae bacterium]|jgi:lantibiotic modifying enzyme|nr:lanthionine synthetase LanC family protein [Longimicrobiaceae bacterium]
MATLAQMIPSAAPLQGTRELADPEGDCSGHTAFISEATRIGEVVNERSVQQPDGSATWLSPTTGAPLGPTLYDGTLGIALFLAALDRVHGDGRHRALVLRAVAPLRRTVRALAADADRARRLRLGTGGLTGAGAFVYGLARIGEWMGEPELVRDAHLATVLLTRERIAGDDRLDVTDGSAGAVLALLALDGLCSSANTADATPVEIALDCAAHLLERRTSYSGRPRAWPGRDWPPLGGYAHGATGVALALMRLYERTGREELRVAALEGIAFERGLYDGETDNWWNPRYERPLEQSAWCHGAPGIALGRAGGLGAYDDAEVRAEIGRTLRSTRLLPDCPIDHLCCGNFGRVEILVTAGHATGDADALEHARGLAARSIARADAAGGYVLARTDEPEGVRSSLFRGLAGVGMALLRLARPDAVPSPLLLA